MKSRLRMELRPCPNGAAARTVAPLKKWARRSILEERAGGGVCGDGEAEAESRRRERRGGVDIVSWERGKRVSE